MIERESLKMMLKKVIDETENDKIKTVDQMMQTLVSELTDTKKMNIKEKHLSKTAAFDRTMQH